MMAFTKHADVPKQNAEVLTKQEQEAAQRKLAQRLASLNSQRTLIRESSDKK
jgi:hypothetical protein